MLGCMRVSLSFHAYISVRTLDISHWRYHSAEGEKRCCSKVPRRRFDFV
jgi:hypothetical protein